MRSRRKGRHCFYKMFCLIIAAMILSATIVGPDIFAKVCIGCVLPLSKFDSYVTSSIKRAGTALSTSESENFSEKTVVTDPKKLAYIPDDIKTLINKAKTDEQYDKKDGAIVEHFYDKSSATESIGNILIRNASDKSIDFKSRLSDPPDLKIENASSEPSVLVFHTHTTESFQILDRDFYAVGFTSRNENPAVNIVRVGDEIVAQLQSAGFKVIHDTNIYDKQYNGAYDRSGAAIDEYLKKYPSIKVILDIHRDAIQDSSGTKTKPVATINGKKAAQIMIISGCEGDGVTDFPDWEHNLRFALKLQQTCTKSYPDLMRPLLFDNRRYNMYKSHCSLLIEFGSDSNTLDEAAYSGRLFGSALSTMLKEYSK